MVLTVAFFNIQIFAWNISNLLYVGYKEQRTEYCLTYDKGPASPRQRASDLEQLSGRVPGQRRAGARGSQNCTSSMSFPRGNGIPAGKM